MRDYYDYLDVDVAIEIISHLIGENTLRELETTNPEEIKRLEQETFRLLDEREQIYKGNREVINKVLTVYGEEVKKEFKKSVGKESEETN